MWALGKKNVFDCNVLSLVNLLYLLGTPEKQNPGPCGDLGPYKEPGPYEDPGLYEDAESVLSLLLNTVFG